MGTSLSHHKSRFDPLCHLDDGVRVHGEHLPLVGHDLFVIFAGYAVERHCVLGLHDPVLASVGYRRTVRVIWKESVMSFCEPNRNSRSSDSAVRQCLQKETQTKRRV